MKNQSSFSANFERFQSIISLMRFTMREYEYEYMEKEEYFGLLIFDNVTEANRVAIQEVLFRAHHTALTSILRNHRWMSGVTTAIVQPNYLAFCACLRGFVESAADSFHSLSLAIGVLSARFTPFRQALAGTFDKGYILCEELEDALIHYSHGRKVPKGEVTLESHQAKTIQEYLKAIEEPNSGAVRALYAELCEVTHPSASTVSFFCQTDPDNECNIRIAEPEDEVFINKLLERHDGSFGPLFQKTFFAALTTLYVLNRYEDPRVFTPGADQVDLSRVAGFREAQERMANSKSL
jgi:hypothetical protein